MGNLSNALFSDAVLLALIGSIAPTLAGIGALIVSLRNKQETRAMKNALIASAEAIGGDRLKASKKMRRRATDTHTNDQEFLQRKEKL